MGRSGGINMDGIKEAIEYLENWMIEPTTENITKVLNKWCDNLYSHIGKDAHEHSLQCEISDETGMSWEELDEYYINKIKEYKKCIEEIEKNEFFI